jgi:hypothetical protein
LKLKKVRAVNIVRYVNVQLPLIVIGEDSQMIIYISDIVKYQFRQFLKLASNNAKSFMCGHGYLLLTRMQSNQDCDLARTKNAPIDITLRELPAEYMKYLKIGS